LWAIALAHERRALGQAAPESGALDALTGVRAAGWRTAVWTNNAREVTTAVLARWGLDPHLDVVVSREDVSALKPAPDGWQVIQAVLGAQRAVLVGDSWVDGLAAAAAGLPFVAYRPDAGGLARWGIRPWATLTDLRALPARLAALDGGPP
jgi:phosphoglycolate phosphatase